MTNFQIDSLCPVFWVCVEGVVKQLFFTTDAIANTFPIHEGRLLFSTPGDCKHHFYHVGTRGSVSPVKLFSISMRHSGSGGNKCSHSSPFFFECCLHWFPAVTVKLWGANGVHWKHLSQKQTHESVSSWMTGNSHEKKKVNTNLANISMYMAILTIFYSPVIKEN